MHISNINGNFYLNVENSLNRISKISSSVNHACIMLRKVLLMNSFTWMIRCEDRGKFIELCSLVSANLLLRNDFRQSVAGRNSHMLASNQKPNEDRHSITHVSICSTRHHYQIHRRSNKKREEAEGWWIQSAGSWLSSGMKYSEKRMNITVDASFEHFDVFSLFAHSHYRVACRRDDATTLFTLYFCVRILNSNGILRIRRVTPFTEYINWSPIQIEQIACAYATCTFFTNRINSMASRSTHKSIDSGWLNI